MRSAKTFPMSSSPPMSDARCMCAVSPGSAAWPCVCFTPCSCWMTPSAARKPYNPAMQRKLTLLDQLLASADNALRTVTRGNTRHASRPNPAADTPDAAANDAERRHSAGLMRVNHAGEIAAQALYQGQSVFARDAAVREAMRESAQEEVAHLAWCEERLAELASRPSRLAPFWYAGSFAIGAFAGMAGDRWSLG